MKNILKLRLCALSICLILSGSMAGCGTRDTVTYSAGEQTASSDQESSSAENSVSLEQTPLQEEQQDVLTSSDTKEAAQAEERTMFVYLCGAVQNPGVYELPSGSRIFQAIQAAGGLTENAETRCLNQAEVLQDGEQVYVYTCEEAEAMGGWMNLSGISAASSGTTGGDTGTASSGATTGDSAGTASSGKVNLNTADRTELMTLSGIGESRADAIIAYREEHGAFSSIEEIMNVSGIKEKMFAQIQDQITV